MINHYMCMTWGRVVYTKGNARAHTPVHCNRCARVRVIVEVGGGVEVGGLGWGSGWGLVGWPGARVRPGPLGLAWPGLAGPSGLPRLPRYAPEGSGPQGHTGACQQPAGTRWGGQAEAGGPGWREARWDLWGWVWVRVWEEVWSGSGTGLGGGLERVWCGSWGEVWTPSLRVGLGVCTPS